MPATRVAVSGSGRGRAGLPWQAVGLEGDAQLGGRGLGEAVEGCGSRAHRSALGRLRHLVVPMASATCASYHPGPAARLDQVCAYEVTL
jgi:hypothetical protein